MVVPVMRLAVLGKPLAAPLVISWSGRRGLACPRASLSTALSNLLTLITLMLVPKSSDQYSKQDAYEVHH